MLLLSLSTVVAFSQTQGDHTKWSRRVWYASLAAIAVSNTLDIQSSWGKHELNGLLAGPGGAFTARSAGIKIGFQMPLIAVEFWQVRHSPSRASYWTSAVSNFAASGIFTRTAIRNYGISAPH